MQDLLKMQQKIELDRQNSRLGLSKLDTFQEEITTWKKQCLSLEAMRILLLIRGLRVTESTISEWLTSQYK